MQKDNPKYNKLSAIADKIGEYGFIAIILLAIYMIIWGIPQIDWLITLINYAIRNSPFIPDDFDINDIKWQKWAGEYLSKALLMVYILSFLVQIVVCFLNKKDGSNPPFFSKSLIFAFLGSIFLIIFIDNNWLHTSIVRLFVSVFVVLLFVTPIYIIITRQELEKLRKQTQKNNP